MRDIKHPQENDTQKDILANVYFKDPVATDHITQYVATYQT